MKLDLVTVEILVDGASVDEADIRRLRYVEGLSELCEADLIVAVPKAAAASFKPGASVRLTIARGSEADNARWVSGVLRSVERLDQGDGRSLEHPLLRLIVVPRVWPATLGRRTRTFIDRSMSDVITATLSDAGLTPDVQAGQAMHPLIVQYQESDFAFMSRLIEDSGALHYVEQTQSGDQWRVRPGATSTGWAGAKRTLRWTSRVSGESEDEGVTRAGRVEGLAANVFRVRDTDRRRAKAEEFGDATRRGEAHAREERDPVTSSQFNAAKVAGFIADEHQPARQLFWLETSDILLRAGEALAAELSRADAEEGTLTELLVVRVEHEFETGEEGIVYRNRAEAAELALPYHPARVTPRPSIVAPQTGVVHSFNGRKHLEVAVEMDWGGAEPCIVPVRTTQPLAGSNHGSILVPALGSEVLVHFIDGVPERPVLIGALYHKQAQAAWATNPEMDPDRQHGGVSGFKSRLAMIGKRGPTSVVEVDDAVRDSEKITMTAINDVDITVNRNETSHIKGTLSEKVTGDVTVALEAKRSTTVKADETYETNGKVSITVHKTGRVLVNESLQMTADTKLSLISGNTRADFSPAAAKITVGGSVIEATASSVKISVGGSVVEITPGGVKITGPIVDLNSGGLVVM
ncbi:MAG: vgrG [Myxococcaceae bacterium]|nr:vgrG [Myxococcaceae bacterium]